MEKSSHSNDFHSGIAQAYLYDDWWVFLNGKLAIDMGGVHGASQGSITLNSATRAAFGLNLGDIVRIDLFQAERHTTQSNFRISIGSEYYRF